MNFNISEIVAKLVIILLVMPIHELAHAFVAYKLGDRTAQYQGRLTLNPLAHIDPIGSVMILFAGIGWAKPVPINPNNFRDPKKGMALSAAAGPASNLIVAFLAMVVMKIILLLSGNIVGDNTAKIFMFLQFFVHINILLAVFNLIPLPPLDGSRVIGLFLPERTYFRIMQYERYMIFVVMFLAFTGKFSGIIYLFSNGIIKFFSLILGL